MPGTMTARVTRQAAVGRSLPHPVVLVQRSEEAGVGRCHRIGRRSAYSSAVTNSKVSTMDSQSSSGRVWYVRQYTSIKGPSVPSR